MSKINRYNSEDSRAFVEITDKYIPLYGVGEIPLHMRVCRFSDVIEKLRAENTKNITERTNRK